MNQIKGILLKTVRSNIFLSVIISAFLYLFFLLLSGFNVYYGTNDDYASELLLLSGDDNSIFFNYFFTFLLTRLQGLFYGYNLLIISQVILCFISLVGVNYSFISRFGKKTGLIFSVITNIIYIPVCLILIQWTHTTVLVATAGYLCLFTALLVENRSKLRIIQAVLSTALVVTSSFYRFNAFEIVCFVVCLFLTCIILIDVWKKKNNDMSLKPAIIEALKKYGKTVLCVALTAVLAFSANIASNYLKNTSPEYSYFKSYNSARSSVVDYGTAQYEGNEKFYNSIGILSQNDLNIISSWYADDKHFDTDTLKQISEYSSNDEFGLRFSISNIFSLIVQKIQAILPVSPIFIIAAGILFAAAAIVLLYKLRNKLKFIFPLALIFVWAAFFYVFKITESSVLLVPIALLVLLQILFFNRYQYFLASAVSLFTVALYIYLNFSRINFRSTFTFLVPVFVFMLFLVDRDNLRVSVKAYKALSIKLIAVVSAAVLFLSSVSVQLYVWNSMISIRNTTDDQKLLNYVLDNQDKVFIFKTKTNKVLLKNYNLPLKSNGIYENTVMFGGWTVGSPYYHDSLEKNNISDIFVDGINSDNIRYIFDNSEENVSMLEIYYNEHFAKDGYEINLVEQDNFKDVSVYRVVSQPIG